MNAPLAIAVAATVVIAGVAPFVAVHIGGKAYGDIPKPKPAHAERIDDTTQIHRIDDDDSYMY